MRWFKKLFLCLKFFNFLRLRPKMHPDSRWRSPTMWKQLTEYERFRRLLRKGSARIKFIFLENSLFTTWHYVLKITNIIVFNADKRLRSPGETVLMLASPILATMLALRLFIVDSHTKCMIQWHNLQLEISKWIFFQTFDDAVNKCENSGLAPKDELQCISNAMNALQACRQKCKSE